MKKLKLILLSAILSFSFTACASKAQTDVLDSSKEDISTLLTKLIEKEKEIIELTQQLEDCKKQCKE